MSIALPPRQRVQRPVSQARDVPALWNLDSNGRLVKRMHGGQSRAWLSDRRFVFVVAGTQAGKTSWGPLWLWREIYGDDTREGAGGGDYLAVTASYDLFKLKMLPSLREYFEHARGAARYWATDRILELAEPEEGRFWASSSTDPMWGRIILRAATAGGGLESATAKAAWLDECGQDEFTVESWEAVLRRLSLFRGRCLGTTTPYNMGWLKTEVYDRWRAGDPDFAVVQFRSTVNPAFPQEELERACATMPPWRFRMFYEGEFTRPAGLIYDCWDDDFNLVAPFEIPPEWPRYVGIDFGGVNNAVVWLAQDIGVSTDVQQSVFYAYRESLAGDLTTAEHIARMRTASQGENVAGSWGGAPSEEQQRRDWWHDGWKIMAPGIADVESGISRVYGLIKPRRLKVFSNCSGMRDEIGSYRRKLDASGQPTEDIVDKRTFHRLDALRYVVCGLCGKRTFRTSS